MTNQTEKPTRDNIVKKVIQFFGLKKSLAAMLTMVILVGLGEKMAERFLPIYILALGGSTIIVGVLNGIDNLLSALYSFPGGYIADRFGYKKALAIFNISGNLRIFDRYHHPILACRTGGCDLFLVLDVIITPSNDEPCQPCDAE